MANGARFLKVKVISNAKIASSYYKMALAVGIVSKKLKPGQFFNIRCSDGLNPLLRRPFSIHRIKHKGEIEILYKVVGRATELLSRKKKGDYLDIIGPLGNGFTLRTTNAERPSYAKASPFAKATGDKSEGKRTTILVAGGMGVAPLLFLAEKVMEIKNPRHRQAGKIPAWPAGRKNLVIIGAKTEEEVLCERDFNRLGFEVLLATEDGSRGKKALATDLLKNLLRTTNDERRTTIYACGPNSMLKEVAKIVKSKKIKAFGSFEEHMACGVGSCYGCAIKTNDGYKRVCKEGPVFNLGEITW